MRTPATRYEKTFGRAELFASLAMESVAAAERPEEFACAGQEGEAVRRDDHQTVRSAAKLRPESP
jgi:hypothetical protein